MNTRQFIVSAILAMIIYIGISTLWPQNSTIIPINTQQQAQIVQQKITTSNDQITTTLSTTGGVLDSILLHKYKTNLLSSDTNSTCNVAFTGDNTPTLDDTWTQDNTQLIWENDTWKITQSIALHEYTLTRHINVTNKTQELKKFTASLIVSKTNSDHGKLFTCTTGINNILDTYKYNGNYTKKSDFTGWIGVNDPLFLTAIKSTNYDISINSNTNNTAKLTIKQPNTLIKPGQTTTYTFTMYAGPKITNHIPVELEKTIAYGFFGIITKYVYKLLQLLMQSFDNALIAIIIFTLLIKLSLLPLSIKGQKSLEQMNKIKPYIEEIKTRYSYDKRVMQLRMLELYKQYHLNPLAMFVPILAQLLVFFPIYKVFTILPEIKGRGIGFGINDLYLSDPTSILGTIKLPITIGILPCLAAISFYAQPENKGDNRFLLPLMFLLIGSKMSSILLVYLILSNIFNVVQYHVLKYIK